MNTCQEIRTEKIFGVFHTFSSQFFFSCFITCYAQAKTKLFIQRRSKTFIIYYQKGKENSGSLNISWDLDKDFTM